MRFALRPFLLSCLCLSSLLLWGCVMGGTGTDTENGVKDKEGIVSITGVSARVVDGNGAPLPGVSLYLYLPGFRPDSGLAPASLLAEGSKPLVSDSLGYVTVKLKAAGKFVVEGVSAGRTVFYDTLAVTSVDNPALFTFRTRPLLGFKGKVKLASGMRIDSGTVFIRGTARFSRVDTSGGYDLGLLPEDAGRMAVGVRFASSPVSVRQVTQSQTVSSWPNPATVSYACKEVSPGSAVYQDARSAPVDTSGDSPKSPSASLDTSKVNSALKSCDSLESGSVISVSGTSKAGTSASADSASVPLLVLQEASTISTLSGTKTLDAVVVSLAECVPAAGLETTSYELHLLAAGSGSDILVGDVAARCLDP